MIGASGELLELHACAVHHGFYLITSETGTLEILPDHNRPPHRIEATCYDVVSERKLRLSSLNTDKLFYTTATQSQKRSPAAT